MVNIKPISIWVNGVNKEAIFLDLICISDNLKDTANFCFYLLDTNLTPISVGNLLITGEDYINFNTSTDSNLFAYNYAISVLNLELNEIL